MQQTKPPYPTKRTHHENLRFLKWCITHNGSQFWNRYIDEKYSGRSKTVMDCSGVSVRQNKFNGFIFRNVDFSNGDFSKASFKETQFQNVKFDKATLSQTIFQNSVFVNCDFSNFDFENSSLQGSSFKECKLDKADLRNVKYLASVEFIDSNYKDAYICEMFLHEEEEREGEDKSKSKKGTNIDESDREIADPKDLFVDIEQEILQKSQESVIQHLVKQTGLIKGHLLYKGVENINPDIANSWVKIWENLVKSLKFLMKKHKNEALPEGLLSSLKLYYKTEVHEEEGVFEVIFGYSEPEKALAEIMKISPLYPLMTLSIISGVASVHKAYNEEIDKFLLTKKDKTEYEGELALINKLQSLQKAQMRAIPRFVNVGSRYPLIEK
jgi:hypothetical protein